MKIEIMPQSIALRGARKAVPFPSQVLLFGGDRWAGITYGAIATAKNGELLGLATLRSKQGQIEAVWVKESHRRKGIGFALCKALIEFYGKEYPIYSEAITTHGWGLLLSVAKEYPQLKIKNLSMPGFSLP